MKELLLGLLLLASFPVFSSTQLGGTMTFDEFGRSAKLYLVCSIEDGSQCNEVTAMSKFKNDPAEVVARFDMRRLEDSISNIYERNKHSVSEGDYWSVTDGTATNSLGIFIAPIIDLVKSPFVFVGQLAKKSSTNKKRRQEYSEKEKTILFLFDPEERGTSKQFKYNEPHYYSFLRFLKEVEEEHLQ